MQMAEQAEWVVCTLSTLQGTAYNAAQTYPRGLKSSAATNFPAVSPLNLLVGLPGVAFAE